MGKTLQPIVWFGSAFTVSLAALAFGAHLAVAAPTPTPTPSPTPTVTAQTPPAPTCAQVGANILLGDPLYHPQLDPDNDGLACETGAGATPQQAKLTCSMLGAEIDKSSPLYRDYLDSDKDGRACEAADYRAGDGPNCAEVGRTNIPAGDRQYAPKLDRDLDGVACEANGEDGPITAAGTPGRGAPAAGPVRGLPDTGS